MSSYVSVERTRKAILANLRIIAENWENLTDRQKAAKITTLYHLAGESKSKPLYKFMLDNLYSTNKSAFDLYVTTYGLREYYVLPE